MAASSKITDRGVIAADGTTKARIERAALNLFTERGVDGVTTREIAAASGISEGAIYRHYSGKEALAEALFSAIHKKLASQIRTASSQSDTIDDQARAIVEVYCQIADDDWALFGYHLLTTHRFLPSPTRARETEQEDPVAAVEEVIAAAMAKGEIPNGDVALAAAEALGVVLQAALHKVYGRVTGDMNAHKEALSKSVIAVLHS